MCDLNSTFKPWPVYKAQVDTLFEEFYAQVCCCWSLSLLLAVLLLLLLMLVYFTCDMHLGRH